MRLALYPLVQQFQYRNGTNLVAGKIYVYYRGRTRLATIYKDQNGTIAQNPLTCDADGRAPCFVDTNYQYTIVVCDARGKELFSQDIDADNAININDALSGDSKLYIINSDGTISVNATSGDTWIQYDLGTFNKPLGVQAPLYWAQDDEECSIIGASGLATSEELSSVSSIVDEKLDTTAFSEVSGSFITAHQSLEGYLQNTDLEISDNKIIGISGIEIKDAELPEDVMSEDKFGYNGNKISSYNGSAFVGQGGSASGTTYSAGDYIDIADDVISVTGLQPLGDYVVHDELTSYATQDDLTGLATKDEINDKLDASAFSSVSGSFYSTANPSGFITGVDLSPYQTIEAMTAYQTVDGMTAYQPVGNYQTAGDYYSASNPSGFITNDAITGLQPSGDYVAHDELTAYATTSLVSSVSSTITGMIPSGEYELVAGSGIELVDDPNAKTTTISVTAQGGNPEVEAEVIAHSADWNTVGDKLDTTAFSEVSGDFLQANDITGKQDIAGMTAYQPTGDYLTTADSANFYTTANESGYLTAIPDTYLQNTDLTIVDDKITEISGVPLSAGDEFPQSATEAIEVITGTSAIWNATTDTVSANSGAWGVAALPISAGPGIKFSIIDNTLVAQADETLLYENYTPSDTINLSEPATAFTTLKVEMSAIQAPAATEYYECIPGSAFAIGKVTLIPTATYKLQVAGAYLTASNNFQTYKVANAIRWYGNITVVSGNDTTTLTANIKDAMYVSRIFGINRK